MHGIRQVVGRSGLSPSFLVSRLAYGLGLRGR